MDWPVSAYMQPESNRQIFLPPLREELKLLPAAANHDGSPAWMVQDPINNSFFRIGLLDFEMLLRWVYGSPEKIVNSVNNETTLDVEVTDVDDLKGFLEQNGLLQVSSREAVDQLREQATLLKKSFINWILQPLSFFSYSSISFASLVSKPNALAWLDFHSYYSNCGYLSYLGRNFSSYTAMGNVL